MSKPRADASASLHTAARCARTPDLDREEGRLYADSDGNAGSGTYPRRVTEFFDVPDGVRLFDSAEEAALAEWAHTPAAGAAVVEVRPSVDVTAVWVVVQLGDPTGFHDQDIVTCVQTPEGQWWASGSTGASSSG